jgi:uncharacterized protein (TIGR04255 family)
MPDKMKYTKAPVSEVILGITFSESVFDINFLFKIQQILEADYPKIEIIPPLTDEWLEEFRLIALINQENTGAFLIRLRSTDLKWLIQIQNNKIYFNWIRCDDEKVGDYVGYSTIKKRFEYILSQINIDLFVSKIKYLDITYHDRLSLEENILSINNIENFINFSPPKINTPQGFNSLSSKYTYQLPELGGYGILSINTDETLTGLQVVRLENAIRGKPINVTITKDYFTWFDFAHIYQIKYFEELFTTDLLEKWE